MHTVAMLIFLCSYRKRVFHTHLSQRTKEALKARKAAGVILGRPKGPGKSKLDQHQAQIREWLSLGVSKKRIAANVGCSVANLHVYLKRRGIS